MFHRSPRLMDWRQPRRLLRDFSRDESASGPARLALPLGVTFALILGWLSLS